MSKLFENELGIYISHNKYIDQLYENVNKSKYLMKTQLFDIKTPYKSAKHKISVNSTNETSTQLQTLSNKFNLFMDTVLNSGILHNSEDVEPSGNNLSALEIAECIYKETKKYLVSNTIGSNIGPARREKVDGSYFLFPENSIFFAKDIGYITQYLKDSAFDLILMDPPWWNKYIRRKRKKAGDGYSMMYNEDLKKIPIEKLLSNDGLVVIWCTNCEHHLKDLKSNIFPKWKVNYVSMWYWVKVTTTGVPICEFSHPPRKQPYERIIFAARERKLPIPQNGKLLVSVPSAIHSHKPPLIEVLQQYLPDNPKCLELFARYLLTGWTSYGNETLKLQHECIFMKT